MNRTAIIAIGAVALAIGTLSITNRGIAQVPNGIPETLKISEVGAQYKAYRIGTSSNNLGDFYGSMMRMSMMSTASGAPGYLAFSDVVYTTGQTVQMYGGEFLVTYALEPDLAAIGMGMSQPKPESGAPETLRLKLIRTSAISTLAPVPEMSGAALQDALGKGPGDTPFSQARKAAEKTQSLSNGKQIALAMIIYSSDYDDVLPYAQSIKTVKRVTMPYTKSEEIWTTKNPGAEWRFNMALAGVSMTAIPNPAEVVLFYESKDWPDGGRIIAYADGHVKHEKTRHMEIIASSTSLKLKRTAKKPLPLQ